MSKPKRKLNDDEWSIDELIEMYRLQAKYFNCGHLRALNTYRWVDKKHPHRKPSEYCRACNLENVKARKTN